jgi:hypothetical protein
MYSQTFEDDAMEDEEEPDDEDNGKSKPKLMSFAGPRVWCMNPTLLIFCNQTWIA